MVGVWLWALAVAAERCDGVDDDGDGRVDAGPVWAAVDGDGDGFGDAATAGVVPSCADVPSGWVSDASDPDDADPDVFPSAPERCNGIDDDGDAAIDEGACGCDAHLVDDTDVLQVCTTPVTYFDAVDACDAIGYHLVTARTPIEQASLFATVDPYNTDVWIGLDDLDVEGVFGWVNGSSVTYTHWRAYEPNDYLGNEDCAEMEVSGLWDDEDCWETQIYVCETNCVATTWFDDDDGDGLGDPYSAYIACDPAPGAVRNSADCDDDAPEYPAAGHIDDDADGYGAGPATLSCAPSLRLSATATDCDDADSSIHPGALDAPGDGIDADCDDVDPTEPPVDTGTAPPLDTGTAPPLDTGAATTGTTDTGTAPTGAVDTGTAPTGPFPTEPDAAPAPDPARDYGFGLGCHLGRTGGWWLLFAVPPALRRRRAARRLACAPCTP